MNETYSLTFNKKQTLNLSEDQIIAQCLNLYDKMVFIDGKEISMYELMSEHALLKLFDDAVQFLKSITGKPHKRIQNEVNKFNEQYETLKKENIYQYVKRGEGILFTLRTMYKNDDSLTLKSYTKSTEEIFKELSLFKRKIDDFRISILNKIYSYKMN